MHKAYDHRMRYSNTEFIRPVHQPDEDVIMQPDVNGVITKEYIMDQYDRAPLEETFSFVRINESWIKRYFEDEEIAKCTVNVMKLPQVHQHSDPKDIGYTDYWEELRRIMYVIITLDGELRPEHNGVIAYKTKMMHDRFSGHAWVLMSSSRAARNMCRALNGKCLGALNYDVDSNGRQYEIKVTPSWSPERREASAFDWKGRDMGVPITGMDIWNPMRRFYGSQDVFVPANECPQTWKDLMDDFAAVMH